MLEGVVNKWSVTVCSEDELELSQSVVCFADRKTLGPYLYYNNRKPTYPLCDIPRVA